MSAGMSKSTVKSAMIGRIGQVRKPIAKPLDRLGEKIRRDIDRRVQPRRMKRVDEDFGLDRRSGAIFEQHGAFAAESRHLLGMAAEESPSRSGSNNIRRGG